MYSNQEAALRRNQAEYNLRKHGAHEYGNTTDAQAALDAAVLTMRTALPGLPLIIQDNQGNLSYLPGLDGPVGG